MRARLICALLAAAFLLAFAAGCSVNLEEKRNIKEAGTEAVSASPEPPEAAEERKSEAAEEEKDSAEKAVSETAEAEGGAAQQPGEEPAAEADQNAAQAGELPEGAADKTPPVITPPPVIHADGTVDGAAEDIAEQSGEVSGRPSEAEGAEEPGSPPAAEPEQKPQDADFVRVKDYIPDIEVLLMYATDGNFTGRVIYDFTEAYLRYGTVKKLAGAQEVLKEKGFRLLIWDAFRPVSAQFTLWAVCPDSTYVANPNTGYSSHSRGNTVDVTVVTMDGGEVEMPTGFDDFSALADRNYSDCTETAAANARMLENVMTAAGFKPYSGEWWHFSDNVSYGVEQSFEPPKG